MAEIRKSIDTLIIAPEGKPRDSFKQILKNAKSSEYYFDVKASDGESGLYLLNDYYIPNLVIFEMKFLNKKDEFYPFGCDILKYVNSYSDNLKRACKIVCYTTEKTEAELALAKGADAVFRKNNFNFSSNDFYRFIEKVLDGKMVGLVGFNKKPKEDNGFNDVGGMQYRVQNGKETLVHKIRKLVKFS